MIELKRFNVHRIVDSLEKAKKLISEGFTVLKDEENILGKQGQQQETVDYSSMTVDQLKELCKVNNLEGYSNLSKDDLITFMKENIKSIAASEVVL